MTAAHAGPFDHLAADLEQALDAAEGMDSKTPAPRAASGIARRNTPRNLLEPARNSELVRMALEEWGMIAVLWAVLAVSPWWLYPPIALLLAGRFHAFGVVLHDAAHLPLRRKTFAIRIVETLCGYPLATTLNAMRYHHLRHHRDSGMPQDPYHKRGRQNAAWKFRNTVRGLALVPFWTVRAPFGAAASLLPAMRSVYARLFLQDRSDEDPVRSREVADCARAEWGQLAAQALVLALVLAYPAPALWGYLVPVSVAGIFAARRVIIEHTHQATTDRSIATLIDTTRDNHLGLWGALFLAPRNIGFHIVHHIHPQVRLGALPRLREWYARTYVDGYPPARR